MMSDITDKVASTYEQTQEYVKTAEDKIQKASDITNDVIQTANQARADVQRAKEMLTEGQADIMQLVADIGDIVRSIEEGDIPSIVRAVEKTVSLVADAVPKYVDAVAEVQSKITHYQQAVERNKEAVQAF